MVDRIGIGHLRWWESDLFVHVCKFSTLPNGSADGSRSFENLDSKPLCFLWSLLERRYLIDRLIASSFIDRVNYFYNPKRNERSFARVRSLILKASSWSIDIIGKNTTRQDFNGVRLRSLLRRDEGYRFGILTPCSIVQFPLSSSIASWKGLGLYTDLISTTPFLLFLATITSLSGYTAMPFNVSLSSVQSPSTDDRSRSSSHFNGAESIPVSFAYESNRHLVSGFDYTYIYIYIYAPFATMESHNRNSNPARTNLDAPKYRASVPRIHRVPDESREWNACSTSFWIIRSRPLRNQSDFFDNSNIYYIWFL